MIRLMIAVAVCISGSAVADRAVAAPVTEAVVEQACGDKIEGGCSGSQCATGCEKMEGGKLVSYGCVFPNKTGATKATCDRTVMTRKGTAKTTILGGSRPVLKAD